MRACKRSERCGRKLRAGKDHKAKGRNHRGTERCNWHRECRPSDEDAFREYAQDARYDLPRWRIHYETSQGREGGYRLTHKAMQTVAARYPKRSHEYYLHDDDAANVRWIVDEIRYLEAKYGTPKQAQGYANMESRIGRGGAHRPDAAIRSIILEIWQCYYDLLNQMRYYTIDQAMHRLLESDELPQFDAVAVDECQDLSTLAIRVLYRMRKNSPDAFMYVAGDESQKIFQRDFRWRDLDEYAKCHGIILKKNLRNARGIQAFSVRLLLGDDGPIPNDGSVHVGSWSKEEIFALAQKSLDKGESVALIGGSLARARKGLPNSENLMQLGELSSKGLEFDTVFVDLKRAYSDTLEEEERLRYVHFTRARRNLYVRCSDPAPELMQKYYAEFL